MSEAFREARAAAAANLVRDTTIERSEVPGRHLCDLSDRWNAAIYPFGGVVSMIAIRAMETELDRPEHTVRSATTVFSSAVESGPLEIDVTTLRNGKRMCQLSANLRNEGSPDAGHTTTAIFGEARAGFDFTTARLPDVPPPEECPPPEEPPASHAGWRAPFFEQLETRNVRNNPPWRDDWVGGRAESIRWFRYRETPRLPSGELDPLALVPLADTMPPALGQYLGPGAPFYFAPSVDLTVHFLGRTREEWLLVRTTCSHAADGYASARALIWDRKGHLLVEATQMMYLRIDAPSPTTRRCQA